MKSKKCFVISPIGEEGSDVRKEADAILWIVEKALEKFDFSVVRVDQLARPTLITNEIVQLIQESDLCVIVLTGENPNVFYEAGRRHETGKPFVQMMRRGERIPFDVAGIRTILYDDLDSRAAAAKTIEELRRYLQEFEQSGYGTSGHGVSLATIASSLDRIERRIEQLPNTGQLLPTLPAVMASSPSDKKIEQLVPGLARLRSAIADPRESFLEAILQGDVATADGLLPRLEAIVSPRELAFAALMVIPAGSTQAAQILNRLIDQQLDVLMEPDADADEEDKSPIMVGKQILAGLVHYYGRRDSEATALIQLGPLIERLLAVKGLSDEDKAFVLNQRQKLQYGAGQYEAALSTCEEVLKLVPQDRSYWYNASTIYEGLKLPVKAADCVDKYMAIGTQDDDHLLRAVRVYSRVGREGEARSALDTLAKVSPAKAAMAVLDDDVRRVLKIA